MTTHDTTSESNRLPVYAVSHGGGPWPWLMDGAMPVDWGPLRESIAAIPADLAEAPRAIVVVTAHWETRGFVVQGNPTPPMIYDYGGFPAHTYTIQYPAPSDPVVAQRVADLLGGADLPVRIDPERGYDHGTFVPMYVMYPEADVPIVQVSIDASFDPALHLAAGRALAPLRDENVLIVGSGFPSFHDLRSFGPTSQGPSRNFDAWLSDTMVNAAGADRSARLERWSSAPDARLAHPREDHLTPLFVAVGAAEGDAAVRNYHEAGALGGWTTSSAYRLGEPTAA